MSPSEAGPVRRWEFQNPLSYALRFALFRTVLKRGGFVSFQAKSAQKNIAASRFDQRPWNQNVKWAMNPKRTGANQFTQKVIGI